MCFEMPGGAQLSRAPGRAGWGHPRQASTLWLELAWARARRKAGAPHRCRLLLKKQPNQRPITTGPSPSAEKGCLPAANPAGATKARLRQRFGEGSPSPRRRQGASTRLSAQGNLPLCPDSTTCHLLAGNLFPISFFNLATMR